MIKLKELLLKVYEGHCERLPNEDDEAYLTRCSNSLFNRSGNIAQRGLLPNESAPLKMEKKMGNETKWEEVSGKLIKTFYFKDYKEVMPFVNQVMKIADKQNHHPDITVHYDNVKLAITDHDKGGVSNKCHKFTDTVDNI